MGETRKKIMKGGGEGRRTKPKWKGNRKRENRTSGEKKDKKTRIKEKEGKKGARDTGEREKNADQLGGKGGQVKGKKQVGD